MSNFKRNPNTRIVVVAFLMFAVSWVVFFLAAMSAITKKAKQIEVYQVTEQHFVNAVQDAVSRFMGGFTNMAFSAMPTASTAPALQPKVYPSEYAYWELRGRPFCQIQGVRLGIGDITEAGVVFGISEERVYIRGITNDQVLIVQRIHPSAAPAAEGWGVATNAPF